MSRGKAAILGFLVVLFGTALFTVPLVHWPVWKPAPKRSTRPPAAAAKPTLAPGTEFTGTKAVGRENGQRKWEFQADRITRSLDGLTVNAVKIRGGRLYEDGKTVCSFEAGLVRYEGIFRRITIAGGIKGRWPDGLTFTAAKAIIDLGREQLIIPGKVKVDGAKESLHADSMTADYAAQMITLQGHVACRWSGGMTLSTEIALFDAKNKQLTAPGEVKVKGESETLRADSMTADLKAETFTLRGHVEGRWEEGTLLHAAEVTYGVKDGTYLLQGMEGERVELSL